jgi:3-phenylpropionate/cinnamic acid dioxygenase small subunit
VSEPPVLAAAHVEAIRRLLHRYAECVDAADWQGLGALFERGEIRAAGMPEPTRGADAVRRLYAHANRVHEDGTLRTRHLVTNEWIDVAPDLAAARSRSSFLVLQATPRLPLQPIAAGRYHDRFVRDDAGWRFAEREILLELAGDLSEHLRIALPGRAAR